MASVLLSEMLRQSEKNYDLSKLPIQENLDFAAPIYTPEVFSPEEEEILKPFFTNIDKPVFASRNLPEEVVAALAAKYSRSLLGLRRMFLNEYALPILHPKKPEDQKMAGQFKEWVDQINKNGGIESVVNVQRARNFFKQWLTGFGDDSIQELGGVHIFVEGVPNMVTQVIENQRVAVAYLEKSSRYVPFGDKKEDGNYRYSVPPEIRNTSEEVKYRQVMDSLFDLYNKISDPYLNYIKIKYPKNNDELSKDYEKACGAKRFDDIRDLLPFATETNVAIFGNGRVYEALINNMLVHPLAEVRWWGKAIAREVNIVMPSLIEKVYISRGAEKQYYRQNVEVLRREMANRILGNEGSKKTRRVSLVSYTPDADVAVLTAFLFSASKMSMLDIEDKVRRMTPEQRSSELALLLKERQFGRESTNRTTDRNNKVPRAFEVANYQYEITGRGGDYRDLHRHRIGTQERKLFNTDLGYDLDSELNESPFIDQVGKVLNNASEYFKKLEKTLPDVAQYAVPYAFLQKWYLQISARELYWTGELRTGPQGRPHYREIVQDMVTLAQQVSPAIIQGLLVDRNSYPMARRELKNKN